MKKLAVCIPTYNHPDTVRDVLNQIISAYNDCDVDLFYFDGSPNDNTKLVIEEFVEKGFDNLFYYHIEDQNGEERFNMIMGAVGPLIEYEYIWYCKDRSYCMENSLRRILQTAENHPDIIFFGIGCQFADSELLYDNSVNFYRDWGWLATSMDVTIIRRESLLRDFYKDKYLNIYWRHFMLIFNELANLDEVHISVLNEQCVQLHNSQLSNSMWTKQIFEIWIDEWISANENLNEVYHIYMNEVIRKATSLPWILGGVKRLMELHQLGVLIPECLCDIQGKWSRVSDIPFDDVRQIAEDTYDPKHDIMKLSELNAESLQLMKQITKMMRDGRLSSEQIPFESLKIILFSIIQNNNKIQINDQMLIEGSIEDVFNTIQMNMDSKDEMKKMLQLVTILLFLILRAN